MDPNDMANRAPNRLCHLSPPNQKQTHSLRCLGRRWRDGGMEGWREGGKSRGGRRGAAGEVAGGDVPSQTVSQVRKNACFFPLSCHVCFLCSCYFTTGLCKDTSTFLSTPFSSPCSTLPWPGTVAITQLLPQRGHLLGTHLFRLIVTRVLGPNSQG